MTYAVIDNPDLSESLELISDNLTDSWLETRIGTFIKAAESCYNNYDTPELVRQFETCLDDVSNWYIRVNRRRFWKQELDNNKLSAYTSLFKAIKSLIQVMAPIIPFLTENMWQGMVRRFDKKAEISVHLSDFPSFNKEINDELLRDTNYVRELITVGLKIRNKEQLKVKQPLSIMYIKGNKLERAVQSMIDIIKDELNVKSIVFLENFEELYYKRMSLNFKTAGKFLKEDLQIVKTKLSNLTQKEMDTCVKSYEMNLSIELPGYHSALLPEFFIMEKAYKNNYAVGEGDEFSVALDIKLDNELLYEGLYRELLRHCQVLRKEAGFNVDQRIRLGISSKNSDINNVLKQYSKEIMTETLAIALEDKLLNPKCEKDIVIGKFDVKLQIDNAN